MPSNREIYFELLKKNNEYLNKSAIVTLLMNASGFTDRMAFYNHFNDEIKNLAKLQQNAEKVENGEPLQYVLGYAYFINGNYIVSPDVLIPRQETEQLAMGTLVYIKKHFSKKKKITIVDVGTGSGILAIYLKENFPDARVIATDISEKAIQIAEKNAKMHNVSIDFRLCNIIDDVDEKIDVLVSNPPYIGSPETVDEQTLKYEPHLALFASPSTKYYREILANISKMNKEFLLAFEIGEDMKDELEELLESEYKGVGYIFEKDMYNKYRFLYILKKKDFDKYE